MGTLASRRRIEPAAAGDTHKVLALTGLGASADLDAEGVLIVGDDVDWPATPDVEDVASNTASPTTAGALTWKTCRGRSLVAVKAEFDATTGTRQVAVYGRDKNDRVAILGIVELESSGLNLGTIGGASLYHATKRGLVSCQGMKDFALQVLATVGPVVDVWGAAT